MLKGADEPELTTIGDFARKRIVLYGSRTSAACMPQATDVAIR